MGRRDRRGRVQVRMDDLLRRAAGVRRLPGEKEVQQGTRLVQVGPRVDGLSEDLFRRDVRRRAGHLAVGHHGGATGQVGQAQVGHVDAIGSDGVRAVGDQYVPRRHVAMNETRLMDRNQPVEHAEHHVDSLMRSEPATDGNDLREVVAVDPLQREPRDRQAACVMRAPAEHADHAGMTDGRGRLTLAREGREGRGVLAQMRVQHLHSDRRLIVLSRHVDGREHRSGAADAEEFPETVASPEQRAVDEPAATVSRSVR